MPIRLKRFILLFISGSLLLLSVGCINIVRAQSYNLVYSSSFASSEESWWVTNYPEHFRWDIGNQRYRYYPYPPPVGVEEYSYTPVTRQNGSFRLEVEVSATVSNGGYFAVGVGNTLRANEGSRIGFAYQVSSGASFFALESYNSSNQIRANYGGSFVQGNWYRHTLIYDASTGSILYAVRNMSNELIATLNLSNVGPFSSMDKVYVLAVTRDNATSEAYLDNVKLYSGGPPLATLTVAANPSGFGYVTPPTGIFEYGSALTLTATAYTGYKFSYWSGDVFDTANPLQIYMIGNRNIVANFVRDRKNLNISVLPPGAGTTRPLSGTYDYGTVVNLTAVESTGYKFSYWSGDVYGITNTATVVMTDNKNVTANFTKQQFNLTTVVAPLGAGTIAPSSGLYDYGNTVTLTAAAGAGYRFHSWAGDVSSTTNPITINMNSNKYVVANFVKPQVILSTSVSPAGSGSVTPTGGTYEYDSTVAISTIAAPGYRFSHWSGDLSGTANPTTMNMTANKNVVANFVREELLLTTIITPGGTGSVVPSGGNFQWGASLALTAVSSPGYRFSHWSGDISGTANPINLIMNSNKNIVANFTTDTSFALTYSNNFTSLQESVWTNNNSTNFYWDSTSEQYRFKLISGSGEFAYILIPTIAGSFRLEADIMANIDPGAHLSFGLGNTVNLSNGSRIGLVAWNAAAGGYFVLEAADSNNQVRASDGGLFRSGQLYKITLSYDTNINTATLLVKTASGEAIARLTRTNAGPLGNLDRIYLSTIGREGAGNSTGYLDNIKVYTSGPLPVNLNIASNPAGAGSVSPGSGTFDYGVSLTLTANASPGYRFLNWSGDITGTTNPLTLNVTDNKNIIANFTFDKSINLVFNTTFSTSTESQWITNNPNNFGWDTANQRYRYRLVANSGEFAYVNVPQITGSFRLEADIYANVDYGSHLSFGLGDTTRLRDGSRIGLIYYNNVGGNYFVLETVNSANQSKIADGGTFVQGQWYRHILTYDAITDTATLTVIRMQGELITSLTRSNIGILKPLDRIYLSTVDRGQMGAAEGFLDNIRLYFIQTSYANLTTSVNPAGAGTVTPPGGVYDFGASITLTAVPTAGYKFSHWTGDASGTVNPLLTMMSTSKNIVANFIKATNIPPPPGPGAVPIDQALASIANQLVTAWGYDYRNQLWTLYDPNIPPALNDLTAFEKGKGYLMNVKIPCVLTYGTNVYPLGAGWNLIGWLG